MSYRKVGYIEQCFYIIKYIIADRVMKHKERKTIKAIELALQIKLTDMQKQYIFGYSEWMLTGRCTGKTTAHCIKICISEGDAIVIHPGRCGMPSYFLDEHHGAMYNKVFTQEFLLIYKALSKTKIKLREVKIEDARRNKNVR